MLSVKFLIMSLIGLMISSEVIASTLKCNSYSRHTYFTATMDSTNYASENVFDLKNVNIVVEYASARNMSCAGHNLNNEISCVGHWFDRPGAIVEFNIQKIDDKLLGKIQNLKNISDSHFGIGEGLEFECEVEK